MYQVLYTHKTCGHSYAYHLVTNATRTSSCSSSVPPSTRNIKKKLWLLHVHVGDGQQLWLQWQPTHWLQVHVHGGAVDLMFESGNADSWIAHLSWVAAASFAGDSSILACSKKFARNHKLTWFCNQVCTMNVKICMPTVYHSKVGDYNLHAAPVT